MENRTDKDELFIQMAIKKLETGLTGKESIG